MNAEPDRSTVAIIGAGPTGLAAAAHALERGIEPIVLEAGDSVGHAVRQWSHVRMFSPWVYNIDKASERLLREAGWNTPDPDHYPTGGELVEHYLEPLATRTRLSGAHPDQCTGDLHRTRRLRQGQDGRPGEGAVRDPLPERQGTFDGCAPMR